MPVWNQKQKIESKSPPSSENIGLIWQISPYVQTGDVRKLCWAQVRGRLLSYTAQTTWILHGLQFTMNSNWCTFGIDQVTLDRECIESHCWRKLITRTYCPNTVRTLSGSCPVLIAMSTVQTQWAFHTEPVNFTRACWKTTKVQMT